MKNRTLVLALLLLLATSAGAQTTTVTLHPNDGLWNFSSLGATLTSGQLLLPDGTAAKPSSSFASDPTLGFHRATASSLSYDRGGGSGLQFYITANGTQGAIQLSSTGFFSWSSTSSSLGNGDVFLYRDAANTLALRNGTNAQAFNVYNTWTDGSNYERLEVKFDTSIAYLQTANLGTGTARNLTLNAQGGILRLAVSGSNRYLITTTGISPDTTDARDLGSTTALHKELYLSRAIQGSKTKALTAGAATSVTQIAVPQTAGANFADANIEWAVYATDGTDSQRLRGTAVLAAVNKAGTETCSIVAGETAASALSASTLTCTPSCVTGLVDAVQFALDCASGLSETTLNAQVFVQMLQPNTLTPQ